MLTKFPTPRATPVQQCLAEAVRAVINATTIATTAWETCWEHSGRFCCLGDGVMTLGWVEVPWHSCLGACALGLVRWIAGLASRAVGRGCAMQNAAVAAALSLVVSEERVSTPPPRPSNIVRATLMGRPGTIKRAFTEPNGLCRTLCIILWTIDGGVRLQRLSTENLWTSCCSASGAVFHDNELRDFPE